MWQFHTIVENQDPNQQQNSHSFLQSGRGKIFGFGEKKWSAGEQGGGRHKNLLAEYTTEGGKPIGGTMILKPRGQYL